MAAYFQMIARTAVLAAVFGIIFSALPQMPAAAEPAADPVPPIEPKICLGYDEDLDVWGWRAGGRLHKDAPERFCPKDSAYYGIRTWHLGDGVLFRGSCCPLPAPDILTSEHIYSREICPPDHVVTGYRLAGPDGKTQVLRCTKINTKRYRLAEKTGGSFWGVHTRAALPWREKNRFRDDEIPRAIFYGIARDTRTDIAIVGCIGDPMGSMLVGLEMTRCVGTYWSALQFSGKVKGDPPEGTEVPMYPYCRRIERPFDRDAECVK